MKIEKQIFYPCPGIIVQTTRIPEIRDAVFHSGMQPEGRSIKNQAFDGQMFAVFFLSDDELTQVNRFRALKKQMEWICGRFAVKTLVRDALNLDLPLEKIQIAYREKGAPYLVQFPEVPISLSHSGDYIAAAVSLENGMAHRPHRQCRQHAQTDDGPDKHNRRPETAQVCHSLGIDIEKIGDLPDDGFMKIAFTTDEIRHMPAEARAVFANWTLKEAFLKYLGMGFNESLHKVAVIDGQIFYRGDRQPVSIWQKIIDSRYALGLVYGKAVQEKDPADGFSHKENREATRRGLPGSR
jgi:4'-phosphopantetheinyl transferase